MIQSSTDLKSFLDSTKPHLKHGAFKRVLMVDPEFFKVEYAINPFMKDESGQLKEVDQKLAKDQWTILRQAYENLGFQVDVLDGVAGLPDMVFAANQSFPFWDYQNDGPAVVMSRMASEFRRKEVDHFREWYRKNDYKIHEIQGDFNFESNGDALLHPSLPLIIGGFGTRTDKSVYEQLEKITGYTALPLELQDERFYHLDTCLTIMSKDVVAIHRKSFKDSDVEMLKMVFPTVIEILDHECEHFFAGNAHCPNGETVIMHIGSEEFQNDLRKNDFFILETDTSEYMKSGGSVFCMKMMTY